MRTRSSVVSDGGAAATRRGVKRGVSQADLTDDQRFTKRFNLLSIGTCGTGRGEKGEAAHAEVVEGDARRSNGNSNLYIPVAQTAPASARATNGDASHAQPSTSGLGAEEQDELMNVDETRDRVYIHDLDAELADIESEEEQLIFLPDIEKRLSKIPRQVLAGGRVDDEHQELVLYSVPKSLTVDEGHDSVRKAIIEARQRARDKAAEEARHDDMNRRYDHNGEASAAETAHGYGAGYQPESDPDAMDIG